MQEATVTDQRGVEARDEPWDLAVVWVHPRLHVTRLEASPVRLGRGEGCTSVLTGSGVSREHIELKRLAHGWVVRDLASKNGTRLNGEPVGEAALCVQDVLRVGEWVGVVANVDAHTQALRELTPGLVGAASLGHAFEQLARVAPSTLDVVLTGETGTGKELFARTLHETSARTGSLVAVNCAALPEHLAEGELFGYRKGAFTSAIRGNLGYLRAANGGTLFLDEVIELSDRIQAKLLRALETRSVVPLGDSAPQAIDFRVVCAAQVPLADRVEAGSFRADLFARLNGIEIAIPPLRQRREEIIEHFKRILDQHTQGLGNRLDADVAEQLCLQEWPLNVRQVVQVATRVAVLHGDQPCIRKCHLPRLHQAKPAGPPDASPLAGPPAPAGTAHPLLDRDLKNQRDRERLVAALRHAHGNVSAAARVVGISRQRAYRLIAKSPTIDVRRFAC